MLLEGVSLAVLPAAWASPCMRPFEGCSHPCVSAVCGDVFRRGLPDSAVVYSACNRPRRIWLGLGASQSVASTSHVGTVRYIGADTHAHTHTGDVTETNLHTTTNVGWKENVLIPDSVVLWGRSERAYILTLSSDDSDAPSDFCDFIMISKKSHLRFQTLISAPCRNHTKHDFMMKNLKSSTPPS